MEKDSRKTITKGLKDIKSNIQDMKRLLNPSIGQNNRYDTHNQNSFSNSQTNCERKYSHGNQKVGTSSRYQKDYLKGSSCKSNDHHYLKNSLDIHIYINNDLKNVSSLSSSLKFAKLKF